MPQNEILKDPYLYPDASVLINKFDLKNDKFNEANAIHPFREGNGRTLRSFCDALACQAGYQLDWTAVNPDNYIHANISGFLHADYQAMELIFKSITTTLNASNDTLKRIKELEYSYSVSISPHANPLQGSRP